MIAALVFVHVKSTFEVLQARVPLLLRLFLISYIGKPMCN